MDISATKKAIIAFSPIGLIHQKHAKPKSLLTQNSTPNQQVYDDGKKQKRKYDCVPKDFRNESMLHKMNTNVKKSAQVCFGGFFNAQKFYTNNLLKKGLEFASDNGALFAAGIALLTTTFLRPLTIFATPGVRKENKEYASAKSISSGIIGFGIMAAISTPIASAIKKINQNPAKYLKETTIKNLSEGTNLVKSKKYKFATQLFKLGADFVSAIPKALLTCALIPPIMLLFFPKKQKQSQYNYPEQVVCFKSGNYKTNQIFKNFIKEG